MRREKRTTKEPRGAATHAGLVEPCFTLAPRRDNERDAVSGAVTDAMADIGAWKWRRRVATRAWSIVDGRSWTRKARRWMARGVMRDGRVMGLCMVIYVCTWGWWVGVAWRDA